MTDRPLTTDASWPPDACSLPTAEQPLRLAEFDQLFHDAVRRADRLSPRRLRLHLDGAAEVERTVRDLTARESACCSFFTFNVARPRPEALTLNVQVPAAHVDVLDALAERARARQAAPR
ncbi:hypothetical protein ACVMYR_12845 [Micromonospora sp. PTRAS2]|uniref:hypothetical protein n=1 Tax=Micromonospora haikouensis TaxID=686309 RepID=UPI0037948F3E